jgi:cytochrome c-type biogenesis protein CcmH/NrfG
MIFSPEDPKFAYTYAYYLNQNKKQPEAIAQLEKTIKKFPGHLSSILLLGKMYVESGNRIKAIDLYTKSMQKADGNQQAVYQLQAEIERLEAL